MRIAALLAAACLVLSKSAWAAALTSSSVGTTAAQFLEMGVDARAMAMGEAYSAVADDATALYWNPAGLAKIPEGDFSMSLMESAYVASSYYDYGAFAQNLGRYGAVGASFQYFTVGAVAQTDIDGTDLGTIYPDDMAATLGYAYRWDNGFSLGASGKYISSKISGSARTEAADVGLLSPTLLDDKLQLALVAQNLGGKLKFDQDSEELPRTYKAGAAWRFNEGWLADLDLAWPAYDTPYAAVGVERIWQVTKSLFLSGQLGFNSRTVSGLDGVNGVSVGIGAALKNFSFNYAFVPMGSLGQTQRFSLAFKFDTGLFKKSAPKAPTGEVSVQYSTTTSLQPPAHLHCQVYGGMTVCYDADQVQKVKIRYEPPVKGQAQPSAQLPNAVAPEPAPGQPAAEPHIPENELPPAPAAPVSRAVSLPPPVPAAPVEAAPPASAAEPAVSSGVLSIPLPAEHESQLQQ